MPVLGDFPGCHVVIIDKRPGRIDQHARANLQILSGNQVARRRDPVSVYASGPHRLDVIAGNTTTVHGRADELENESRVVVVQVGVRVLEGPRVIARAHYRLFAIDGTLR